MPVPTDTLPPRYRDPEHIGSGGMGEIFRATDQELGRDVAVKVLAERYAQDAQLRERFKREALAAARLSGNPNIVTIFDVDEHNGRPLISRAWIERMHTPDKVAPFYGLLTWLNADGGMFKDASRASYFMFGAGGHQVWIDPESNAVIVTRWLEGSHAAGFVTRVAKVLGG